MGKVDLTMPPTIGFEDHFDGFRLSDGEIVNVRIMDTCGQERYDALFSNYYKDADCCLLVYDITSEQSFNKIKNYYIGKIKDNCKSIIRVILLGNKTDLVEARKISKDDGAKLAEEKDIFSWKHLARTITMFLMHLLHLLKWQIKICLIGINLKNLK